MQILNAVGRTCFALFVTLVLAAAPAAGQTAGSSNDLMSDVDAAAKKTMEDQRLVGLAIALIQEGKVSQVKGYGFQDREASVPVTDKTMFRWASISKLVTAVLAMQLVNAGELDLNADVRSLVPEFPAKEFGGEKMTVTIRDLLCHQGGIVHYSNGRVVRTQQDYGLEHPFEDVVLALDRFRESPLVNAPGQRFSYTTHGYMLLGAAVQRAGKQKFALQGKKRIFEPLGMTSMQPDYQWIEIDNRAVGYRLRRGEVVRSTNTDVSWKLAGGGFISNVGDLARFGTGLMSEDVLPESVLQRMKTPQKTTQGGRATRYGLGFNVRELDGHECVGHTGSQEKAKTALFVLPERKLGVAIMCNSENASLGSLTNELLRLLVAQEE
ncbi:MAG: beta-lactamase family protein [Pirellulales bacterium]|nr:beta-lactamase family protein [Pirellulales bacterium]